MSAPTRESLLEQLAAERDQRQSSRLGVLTSTLLVVRCGRIDPHDPHEWVRPRLFGCRAVRYQCNGPGVLEGGAR